VTVYLAGPIDGCDDLETFGWRREATALLAPDFDALDPTRSLILGPDGTRRVDAGETGVVPQADACRFIVDQDLRDIQACDVLLARCTRPSFGTPMEIFRAFMQGKVVVLWRDALPDLPPWSPWLVCHSHARLPSLPAAVELVKKSTPT
jgi:nucleoside 2-deoxyribosyltransferase